MHTKLGPCIGRRQGPTTAHLLPSTLLLHTQKHGHHSGQIAEKPQRRTSARRKSSSSATMQLCLNQLRKVQIASAGRHVDATSLRIRFDQKTDLLFSEQESIGARIVQHPVSLFSHLDGCSRLLIPSFALLMKAPNNAIVARHGQSRFGGKYSYDDVPTHIYIRVYQELMAKGSQEPGFKSRALDCYASVDRNISQGPTDTQHSFKASLGLKLNQNGFTRSPERHACSPSFLRPNSPQSIHEHVPVLSLR